MSFSYDVFPPCRLICHSCATSVSAVWWESLLASALAQASCFTVHINTGSFKCQQTHTQEVVIKLAINRWISSVQYVAMIIKGCPQFQKQKHVRLVGVHLVIVCNKTNYCSSNITLWPLTAEEDWSEQWSSLKLQHLWGLPSNQWSASIKR